MIDLRLITFLTVAKTKNFTRAGEILNLTQPAVSQHIKFLEEYYGVNFIKKQGRQIALTEEGEVLFRYAQELEVLSRALTIELKNKTGIRKIYNLGATMTIGGYTLPHILAEYKKTYKNIDILLQVNNTQEIIEKLLARKLDLALVEGPFNQGKFNYKKFKNDELVLAISPRHPFAQSKAVSVEKIIQGNLILREKGSGTREIWENKLTELGYNPDEYPVYMEIGSINAIKSLVEANLGYTIISKEAVKRELELGVLTLVPISNVKIQREFNFIYLSGTAEEFINHFINFCSLYSEESG